MTKLLPAAVLGLSLAFATVSANAQTAPAPAAAAGKINVNSTKIEDLIKNPGAKALLEKALPEIAQFYDQIGSMTLADVAPMSQGALDDAKLKALQAEFDKL